MCPPGTDQTERGPQSWNLLAPLLQEMIVPEEFDKYPRRSLSPFEYSKRFEAMFKKLARTTDVPSGNGATIDCTGKSLASVEDLPSEVIANMLSDDTLEKQDVVSFGACSKLLWMHAFRYIQADVRGKSTASWAGTPLVFTGSYLKTFPPALYDICPKMQQLQNNFGGSSRGKCPARRWETDATMSFRKAEVTDAYRTWRGAICCILAIEINQQLLEDMEKDRVEYAKISSGRWFLRNLTAREYTKLDVEDLDAIVAGTPWLTLDMALLMQIRWSSPRAKISREHPRQHLPLSITRIEEKGPWAGHRFDVVREKPAGDAWRDATSAVVTAAEKKASEVDCWD